MDRFSLSRDSEKAALGVSMETRHNRGKLGQGGSMGWTVGPLGPLWRPN